MAIIAAYVPQVPAGPSSFSREWAERIASVMKQLVSRQNCVGTVTLDAVANNTTITDFRIHPACVLAFMPLTSAAATATSTIYVPTATIAKGTAVVRHAAGGGVGQDFQYAVIG